MWGKNQLKAPPAEGPSDRLLFRMEFPCMLRLSQEGLMTSSGIYYSGATRWSHVARPSINHSSKVTWTS